MYTSFPSVIGACTCTVSTGSPPLAGACSASSWLTNGSYAISTSLLLTLCPATFTIPACCGFAPHCAQNGVVDATPDPTVKVTVIIPGDPCAPFAVTVMWPTYVFGVLVGGPRVAEICSVIGAVPLAGVTISHDESLLALNISVPLPVFVTSTEAGAGFVFTLTNAPNRSDCVERLSMERPLFPVPPPPPHAISAAQNTPVRTAPPVRFI